MVFWIRKLVIFLDVCLCCCVVDVFDDAQHGTGQLLKDYCNLVLIAVLLLFAHLIPLVSASWGRKRIMIVR